MDSSRLTPDNPREWLNRARSNLSQAEGGASLPGVYLEDLCFQAQQAAEKAIKAVLIYSGIRFPHTHDLATLLSLVQQSGRIVPKQVQRAAILTEYAVQARYPGLAEPVTTEEYTEAIAIARRVIRWVEGIVT